MNSVDAPAEGPVFRFERLTTERINTDAEVVTDLQVKITVCCGVTPGNFAYLLTPWCRILLAQLTGLQIVKKFPAFHGTPRFITALTSVRHLSLSWASPIQTTCPHPTSWRSILILSTHLCLGLPSGLLPHQDPVHSPLLNHMRHMLSPSHSSRFYHPHNIG